MRRVGYWLAGLSFAGIVLALYAATNSIPAWIFGPGPEEPRRAPAGWDSVAATLERDSLERLVAACSVAIDTARDNTFQRLTGRKPER